MTNALAIIAMGSVTFVITGVARSVESPQGAVRHWVVAFAAFAFVVLWGLSESTSSTNAIGARTSISRRIVEEWATERTYDVESVEIGATSMEIVLIGESAPDDDSVGALVDRLSGELDDLDIELRVDLAARITID